MKIRKPLYEGDSIPRSGPVDGLELEREIRSRGSDLIGDFLHRIILVTIDAFEIKPEPDTAPPRDRPASRRYPPPTD